MHLDVSFSVTATAASIHALPLQLVCAAQTYSYVPLAHTHTERQSASYVCALFIHFMHF